MKKGEEGMSEEEGGDEVNSERSEGKRKLRRE